MDHHTIEEEKRENSCLPKKTANGCARSSRLVPVSTKSGFLHCMSLHLCRMTIIGYVHAMECPVLLDKAQFSSHLVEETTEAWE